LIEDISGLRKQVDEKRRQIKDQKNKSKRRGEDSLGETHHSGQHEAMGDTMTATLDEEIQKLKTEGAQMQEYIEEKRNELQRKYAEAEQLAQQFNAAINQD